MDQNNTLDGLARLKKKYAWLVRLSIFFFFIGPALPVFLNESPFILFLSIVIIVISISGFVIGVFKESILRRQISYFKSLPPEVQPSQNLEIHNDINKKGFNSVIAAFVFITFIYGFFEVSGSFFGPAIFIVFPYLVLIAAAFVFAFAKIYRKMNNDL